MNRHERRKAAAKVKAPSTSTGRFYPASEADCRVAEKIEAHRRVTLVIEGLSRLHASENPMDRAAWDLLAAKLDAGQTVACAGCDQPVGLRVARKPHKVARILDLRSGRQQMILTICQHCADRPETLDRLREDAALMFPGYRFDNVRRVHEAPATVQ